MTVKNPIKISDLAIIEMIGEARNAELCRDLPESRRILSAVWEDIDQEPKVEGFELFLKAEILRLCGFHLSYHGRAHNQKKYQARGKDYLSEAIRIFDSQQITHKSAEAKVMLALCYWYEGEINESETILSEIEAEYAHNPLHVVSLQICINRLMIHYYKQEFEAGIKIVEKLKDLVTFCTDWRLVTMYHNQAGIISRRLKKFDTAVFHFHESLKSARLAKSERFCAINYNNLANVYKDVRNFELAHANADKAIKFYDELGEVGWLAHILDTKANIYLDENEPDSALQIIDRALDIFNKGEDYAGLAESLFTKCQILLRLNSETEAFLLFAEIVGLTKQRIGKFAADRYANDFIALIYSDERVALKQSEKNTARGACPIIEPISVAVNNVKLGEGLSFVSCLKHFTFLIDSDCLCLPIPSQKLVALTEKREPEIGDFVILQNKEERFFCNPLEIDGETRIPFFRESGNDFPLMLEDFTYYGKVIAYCPLSEANGNKLIFRPFI